MVGKKEVRAKRVFSVELRSGSDLSRVSIPNGSQRMVIEGTIGALRRAEFIEDSVLELVGTNGTLRVDLSRVDLTKQFLKPPVGDAD